MSAENQVLQSVFYLLLTICCLQGEALRVDVYKRQEYKSKYGAGEPTDIMIDALLADFRKAECDRIIAIGGGAVIDMAKILVLDGNASTCLLYTSLWIA